ncbi:hypothetical protein H0H87_001274 [Tephrocybe sp. NHM501043]|nr:hypothetical protein H0H87_001274 [Tephrocybe sp. NHM501043]
MAPTTQNDAKESTSTDPELIMQQSPAFAHARRGHNQFQQRLPCDIWRRQNRPDAPQSPATPNKPLDGDTFEQYISSIPLHAIITPNDMPTSAGSRLAHLSITEIILILCGTLIAIVLGVTVLVLMRSIVAKKARRLMACGCGRQKAKKSKAIKGALVINDEDDPTWGTPPRFVYVEGINNRPGGRHSTGPFISSDSPPSPPSPLTPNCGAHVRHNSSAQYEEDSFRGCLKNEENDITLAPDRALCSAVVEPTLTTASALSLASALVDDELVSLSYVENLSIYKSLQASIDNLAKGVSSAATVNRPRQGSDASSSSGTTVTTSPDGVECFSILNSESSMTSMSSSDSSLDQEPEEIEVVYEVRRAHAQSIELKKGILVTCLRASSIARDISPPGSVPTFVISEAAPVLPLDDQAFAPLFSFRNSISSKASLSSYAGRLSLSSIIRENSRGTMASLSTSFSTTQTDECCQHDEQYLQPPIPCLMLTRPSDSSIYTLESCASSISVDLSDFPLPPIPAKPTYYSKLIDQVQRMPKRIWDNHFEDSSVSQKRSTVERFISMYSRA